MSRRRKIDLDRERTFENEKVENDNDIRVDQNKYYWAVRIPFLEHDRKVLGFIEQSSVLEIGCSEGSNAKLYCGKAKSYVGIDISDKAIAKASSLGLENAAFFCSDAHRLKFDDGMFDCVIVNSLLHHLSLQVVMPEIHRVTKNGGFLVYREPLGLNPLYQMYRFLTPNARTPDEKPFDASDLTLINKYFDLSNSDFFGFLNLVSAWCKFLWVRRFFSAVDRSLSKTPLRYLFWQIAGIGQKK